MGINVPMNFEKTSIKETGGNRNLLGINKSQSQALVPLKGTMKPTEYEPPKQVHMQKVDMGPS